MNVPDSSLSPSARIHYLDAVRAFALLLGIVFHASLSFLPMMIGWAVMDVSTSSWVAAFVTVSHSFRMELFFVIAGFFAHLSLQRRGTADLLRSRALRIGLPFVVGWFLLRPLIVSGWIMGAASMQGEVQVWPALVAGFQSLRSLPDQLFVGSHLWFLYYLLLITTGVLGLRALGRMSGLCGPATAAVDAAVRWMAERRLGLLLLFPPTAAALWSMRGWGMDTPDQSLVPHLPVLAVYGGGFVLGWFLHRNASILPTFTRITLFRVAALVLAVVVTVWSGRVQADPGHPDFGLYRILHAGGYTAMMWLLVVLVMGIFRKVFDRARPWVRYLADASYWMYLIHLPLVVWMQVAVAEWPLHWSIKLVLISAATLALTLLTYDLFVRSTLLGRILNGTRRAPLVVPALNRWARRAGASGGDEPPLGEGIAVQEAGTTS